MKRRDMMKTTVASAAAMGTGLSCFPNRRVLAEKTEEDMAFNEIPPEEWKVGMHCWAAQPISLGCTHYVWQGEIIKIHCTFTRKGELRFTADMGRKGKSESYFNGSLYPTREDAIKGAIHRCQKVQEKEQKRIEVLKSMLKTT